MGVQIINFASFKPAAGGGGASGIEIAGVSAIASGTGTTNPTLPTHQADDIIIVCGMNHGASGLSCSGYTQILASTTGISGYWWWKRAASGAESNPSVTGGGGAGQHAIAYVVRGCVTSGTPYEDATLYQSNSDQTPDTSVIDTTGAGRLAVAFEGHFQNQAYSSGLPPSGWDLEDSRTTANNGGHGFACISKEVASAGTVASVVVATLAAATYVKTCTLAFIPD